MSAESNSLSSGHEPIPSGSLIGNRYCVQNILGQGGLGRTYLALNVSRFNELCVLKEFAPLDLEFDDLEKSQNLFRREAKILYQLKHPQITQFFACFDAEGRLFLVQEYIHGISYAQLLRERSQQGKTFTEIEIIKWIKDLLPVLDYIHNCGIIHRDISPDNIMQPHDGGLPVLIDFGVGKQTLEAVTTKKTFVGKIGYAPYEQINLGRCFPNSDLYALGVTAIVLLSGKPPAQMMNIYSCEWQWSSLLEVSKLFNQILEKLTAYNPKHRYQSAQEVIADLKHLQPEQVNHTDEVQPSLVLMEQSTLNSHFNQLSQPKQSAQKNTQTLVQDIDTKLRSNFPPKEIKVTLLQNQREEKTLYQVLQSSDRVTKPQVSVSREFIKACQQQLAYCIGPIATLIVEEILNENPSLSHQQLIDAIALNIPDEQQQLRFQKSVLDSFVIDQ